MVRHSGFRLYNREGGQHGSPMGSCVGLRDWRFEVGHHWEAQTHAMPLAWASPEANGACS